MKKSLSVKDRLVLDMLMPKQGSAFDLVVSRNFSKRIEFGADEQEALNLRMEDGQLKWDSEKEKTIEVEFKVREVSVIKKAVENLDKNNNLGIEAFEVCEKLDLLPDSVKEKIEGVDK